MAGDARRTYAELDERANRFAHHLLDAGVGPGDQVAIHAWNRAEWIEAELGIYKARAVPVNVNYRYVADELRYILDNADAVAVVFERSFAPMFAAIRERPAAAPPLVVLEDGSDRRPVDGGAVAVRGRARGRVTRSRLRTPLRRRPLLPLHRRHDRHAQGRDVARRGHLLRRAGRRRVRPDADQDARGARRARRRRRRPHGQLS